MKPCACLRTYQWNGFDVWYEAAGHPNSSQCDEHKRRTEPMTVKELIEVLLKFPMDYTVTVDGNETDGDIGSVIGAQRVEAAKAVEILSR